MPVPMPPLEGVEHTFHELPTGVRVHVASMGPADAPAVLALHGWPQHWWAWRDVMRALDRELRVVAPDVRGFGWSGWPADGDFRKQRIADDAIALLDALGLERVRLVGHDWGGWAAILAALAAPERFSSLLAMSVGHPWTPTDVAARNGWRLVYQLPLAAPLLGELLVRDGRYAEWMLKTGRRDASGWGPGEVEAYVDVLRDAAVAEASSRVYRDFLVKELPAAARGDLRHRRPAMPARLLIGSREPLRPFAEGFPGELEVVEGAGHFLPEEAPEAVAERIRAM